MKKTILAMSIFSILLMGCNGSDSKTNNNETSSPPQNTHLNFGEKTDKVQITSLKYPNSTSETVDLLDGKLKDTPILLGQAEDLFIINYLSGEKNIGFILATKQQILDHKIEFNEFSFLISNEAMERFLGLSYADMIIFTDLLADKILKEDLDGNKTINYEDIFSLNKNTQALQKLEFNYDEYFNNKNNSFNMSLNDAYKTADSSLFRSIMDEVFDSLIRLEEPAIFTKTVYQTEISSGENGEITSNDPRIETLNKDNNTAVLLNNPIEGSATVRTTNISNITLTATPTTPNMVFEGWEGCENSNANTCTIDLNQNNKVYAHFGSIDHLETPNWNTKTCAQAKVESVNNELPTACLSLKNYISPSDAELNQGRAVFAFGTDGCYASAPVYTALDGSLRANPGIPLAGSKTDKCNYFDQMNNAYLTYHEVSSNKSNYKARIFGLYAVKDQCSPAVPEKLCGHKNEWEHVIIWMKDNQPEYVTHTRHGWIETKEASKATHLANAPNTFVFKYIQEGTINSHYPDFAGSKNGIYIPSEQPTPQGTLFGHDSKQILDYKYASTDFKQWFESKGKTKQSWERVTQRIYDNSWLNSKVCPVRVAEGCEKHWFKPNFLVIDKVPVMPKAWENAKVKF